MIVCSVCFLLSGNMLRKLGTGFLPLFLSTYIHNEVAENG